MISFLWLIAGVALWILAVIEMPDTIPWWFKALSLSFYCFFMAILAEVRYQGSKH